MKAFLLALSCSVLASCVDQLPPPSAEGTTGTVVVDPPAAQAAGTADAGSVVIIMPAAQVELAAPAPAPAAPPVPAPTSAPDAAPVIAPLAP